MKQILARTGDAYFDSFLKEEEDKEEEKEITIEEEDKKQIKFKGFAEGRSK